MRGFFGDYISLVLDSLIYPESMFPKCSHLLTPLDVVTPYYVVGGRSGDNYLQEEGLVAVAC